MSEHHCKEFRCPAFVPADAPDDFCIPEECCPERIPTPKFPSPNTCLPPEELEDLERRIEAANELLLSLALARRNVEEGDADAQEEERLRQAFEGLQGQFIKVELAKQEQGRKKLVQGFVCLVGRDFVLLEDERFLKVFRLEDVCSIKHDEEFHKKEHEHDPMFDPCLRRAITLDFGATVGQSPELIQLFFGLDLNTFLCFHLGKRVYIVMKRNLIRASLIDINADKLTFMRRRKIVMNLEDIYLLKIRKEARKKTRRIK
ncbi:hypothetical protein [Halalkalibacter sp. APA_J-10(15)]|uniref:hypothetical protein n=1 Tax=Halalkalibacter sp. APA_J-10(15) TaxID=2933805 RepID=UPI001FF25ED4|nr:hypothetical protein [Halalkalibacter sp. APA_J-10(15)]MCK0472467.1 hypothetical protein [Halalkalibacter sp. APA_J-10(15)]